MRFPDNATAPTTPLHHAEHIRGSKQAIIAFTSLYILQIYFSISLEIPLTSIWFHFI